MRTWCTSDARAPTSGIRLTPRPFKSCSGSSTPNAVPGTRRLNRRRLSAASEDFMIKPKVLFLCTGNSRRTQMAEGFLRAMAGDRFDVMSAGSEETPLDPDAVAVMREVGVDISGQETKAVNRFLGRRVSYLVTLCDREKE